MRIVIQRVNRASVSIGGEEHSSIGRGLLVLVGVGREDTLADADRLAAKTAALRIFPDAAGVMNVAIADIPEANILAVSQFTLMASTRKGNRPSYVNAAGHDLAVPVYERYCQQLQQILGRPTKMGVFGADMQVELINDGPVTIIMDTEQVN